MEGKKEGRAMKVRQAILIIQGKANENLANIVQLINANENLMKTL